MNLVRTRVFSRMWFVAMLLVVFGLTACGGNNTKFKTKKDVGTDPDNEQDSGYVSDAGSNPGKDGGPNGGSDTEEEENDDNNPCRQTTADDAAEFARDYAEALCVKMLSCERNREVTMISLFDGWPDQASCVETVLAKHMTAGQAKAAVDNKTMRIDSCAATKCLDEIADLACSDADTPYKENYVPGIHHCYEATAGKVKEGKPCTISGQCGEGKFCQPDESGGTCGGTCEDVGLSFSGQCGEFICRGDQYCTDNDVCINRIEEGDVCEFDFECVYDAECVDSKCESITAGLEENAACDSMNALCKLGLICYDEVCKKPAELNEACQYAGCVGGLFCSEAGTCEERGSKGTSCDDNSNCKSLSCVSGSCTDPDALCP